MKLLYARQDTCLRSAPEAAVGCTKSGEKPADDLVFTHILCKDF